MPDMAMYECSNPGCEHKWVDRWGFPDLTCPQCGEVQTMDWTEAQEAVERHQDSKNG